MTGKTGARLNSGYNGDMEDGQRCVRPLTCPICHQFLQRDGGGLVCPAGHSFDLAREGYVNLLPTRKRLAATVGDSAEMLQARRRFFAEGLYAPLAARVAALAQETLAGYAQTTGLATAVTVLDCGCGEGYYTGQVQQQLAAAGGPVCAFGLDVAKTAVKMAAKKYPGIQFVAADINGRVPFADQSVHLLLNIFAPRNPPEFARLCAGSLLMVIPTPHHLQTLRQSFGLLAIESDKHNKIQAQFQPTFHQILAETITLPLLLNQQQIQDLVQMTPNARHLTPPQEHQLTQTTHLETQAQFQLLLFKRKKGLG